MTRRGILIFVLTLALLPAFAGCEEDSPVTPPTVDPVDFATEVQPIFNLNCSACHTGGVELGELNLDAGMSLAQLINVAAEGYPGRIRVVPGNADSSALYLKLSGSTLGGRMPPAGPLVPEPIEIIRRWINEGANE